jgi:hypothetical protein
MANLPKPPEGPLNDTTRPQLYAFCNNFGVDECQECKARNMDCADLVDRINKLTDGVKSPGQGIKGLKQRWGEQEIAIKHNRQGVYYGYCPPGTQRYLSHTMEYLKQQQQLKQRLKELDDRQPPCPNKDQVNPEAREWAEKRLPDSGTHSMQNELPQLEVQPPNPLDYLLMRAVPALRFMPPGLIQELMRPYGPMTGPMVA